MTRYLFPVVSLTGGSYQPTPHMVAVFFTDGDATDFINAELGSRNLYLAEPRSDRRKSGYRPVEKPSGYEEWLMSLDTCPQNNRPRIAA